MKRASHNQKLNILMGLLVLVVAMSSLDYVQAASCGDGRCDTLTGENCSTCAVDCGCPPGEICLSGSCVPVQACGDDFCDTGAGENCSTCAADCGCPPGETCVAGSCVIEPSQPVFADGFESGNLAAWSLSVP